MENIRQLLPDKPLGVYTGYYYWNEFARGVDWFGQFPLWIAWYNPEEPLIPSVWKEWTYWQFTDDHPGALFGVESREIDMNRFMGTKAEFLARYGGTPAPKKRIIHARYGDKIAEYKEK